MWKYEKMLQYPVNIKKRDLKMAQLINAQVGGPQGELGAALRYLNQSFTMPDDVGKALLTDIGTEELGHVEMLQTMIKQLTDGATIEEIKAAGFDKHYTEHGLDLFPANPNGIPFTTAYISAVGDTRANLVEDLAAEEKSSRAMRRKRGSSGCGRDSRASSRVETGMWGNFLSCSKGVKDSLEIPELKCD